MGALKKLNRAINADKARLRNIRLSKDITKWYAEHPLSAWQKQKVEEIRADYEEKQKALDQAHDIASSDLSDVYMEFELEYLKTSHRFREDNPGKEYHPKGMDGFVSRAKSIVRKAATYAKS
jgi:hypothetical protein